MKILLFNDYSSNVGGAERFFDAMYQALQHAQLKVYTAALQEKPDNHHLNAFRNANHRILIHPKIVQTFEALIARIDPDLVHLNSNNLYTNSILHVLHRHNIPVVQTAHDFYLIERLKRIYYLDRSLPIQYVTPSLPLSVELSRLNRPVTHLKIGINLPFWAYQPFQFRERSLDLLYVGRLEHSKGVMVLLEAFKPLAPNFQLTLVGDGSARDSIAAWISAHELDNRVTLAGHCNDAQLRSFYHRAKLLVFPSLADEGLGYVGLEAQACGLPVVAFDVRGVEQWCRDVQTGFLVKQHSPEALRDCIRNLMESPKILASVAQRARQFVESQFSTSFLANQLADVYDRAFQFA
ncbi:MAG: glycosyltransferase family 4 protein [Saprospiraceae bacterium]|jgi:glycosyltransferase involved in cell wall biosynthesis